MHYRLEAAKFLSEILLQLEELDRLSDRFPGHRLESFEPLAARLRSIMEDLLQENRMLPAKKKCAELVTRLIGGHAGLRDPKFRSAVGAILGSYQRKGDRSKARLGGLTGGRPRKDGKPRQTLQSKGYSAGTLPPPKEKGVRVHPTMQAQMRAAKLRTE